MSPFLKPASRSSCLQALNVYVQVGASDSSKSGGCPKYHHGMDQQWWSICSVLILLRTLVTESVHLLKSPGIRGLLRWRWW